MSTSYFASDRFPGIGQHWQQGAQSTAQLMRAVYGCEHIRRTPEVAARLVRPDDAKLLKVSLNQPILLVQSVNVNEDGDVTEYRINRFRGDSMELVLGE